MNIEQEVGKILRESKRREEISDIIGSLYGVADQLRDLIVIPVWKNNGARVWHTCSKNEAVSTLEIMKTIIIDKLIERVPEKEEDEDNGRDNE